MKIGLVLSAIPGYSETFFYSMIKELLEAGNEVILFTTGKKHDAIKYQNRFIKDFPDIKSRFKINFSHEISKKQTISGKIYITGIILKLLITNPTRFFRFIKLEKTDKLPIKEIIGELYLNAHILPYKLDWLHFGFATTGIRRENVAGTIKSRSAVSFRGYDINVYPLKHPNCYDKLWKSIDKIHTISEYLYKKALTLGLSPKVPYTLITPAIDTGKFTAESYKLNTDKLKIITVGRLTWIKGYEYAISALSILKQEGIDFEYQIVGEGEDRERLIFAAYQMGISDNVKFVGKKSPEQTAILLKSSDLYIQPSVMEGFCNSVLEAQASGLLCIVSDAGALPENVIDQKSGFLVKSRDPQQLASKIKQVMNMSDNDKEKIINFAIFRVKSQFNIEEQKRKFIEFYK